MFEALRDIGVITMNTERITYTDHHADLTDRYVRLFYSDEINTRIRGDLPLRPARSDAFSFTV